MYKFDENYKSIDPRSPTNTIQRKHNKNHTKHTVIKLLKTSNRENLKNSHSKKKHYIQKDKNKDDGNFSLEIMQARRK